MTALAEPVEQAEATVYTFQKNAREHVRATLSEYRGHRVADLRVFVEDEAGGAIPTPKGLCIGVQHLAELRDAVDALLKAAA